MGDIIKNRSIDTLKSRYISTVRLEAISIGFNEMQILGNNPVVIPNLTGNNIIYTNATFTTISASSIIGVSVTADLSNISGQSLTYTIGSFTNLSATTVRLNTVTGTNLTYSTGTFTNLFTTNTNWTTYTSTSTFRDQSGGDGVTVNSIGNYYVFGKMLYAYGTLLGWGPANIIGGTAATINIPSGFTINTTVCPSIVEQGYDWGPGQVVGLLDPSTHFKYSVIGNGLVSCSYTTTFFSSDCDGVLGTAIPLVYDPTKITFLIARTKFNNFQQLAYKNNNIQQFNAYYGVDTIEEFFGSDDGYLKNDNELANDNVVINPMMTSQYYSIGLATERYNLSFYYVLPIN